MNGRIRWLDISRGFLIILVVLAHCMVPRVVFSFLSYLVAGYLFISGYLHKDRPFKILVVRRFTRLIIPYFVMGFMNIAIFFVTQLFITELNFTFLETQKKFLLVYLGPGEVPYSLSPLWYLPMFFMVEVFYGMFRKLHLTYAGIVLGLLVPFFGRTKLPWEIDTALFGLIFFHIGVLYRRFKLKVRKPLLLLSSSIVILSLVVKYNGLVDLNTKYYGTFPLLTFVGEICYIGIIIGFSALIEKRHFSKVLELFGRNTLFILGYHIVIGIPLYLIFSRFMDPIAFVRKYWYIYFCLNISIVYLLIRFLPGKVIHLFTGELLTAQIQGRGAKIPQKVVTMD